MNWRDSLKEGPTEVPEHKIVVKGYITCSGCKYYNMHMLKSGNHPIYGHGCTHPEVQSGNFAMFRGNLEEDYDGIVHTPEWCPFLKNKSNESETPKEAT